MKKELLEYIIRECVKEVLAEALPDDQTVGAPAPPEAGQGTADQPPIPQPTQPEVPTMVGKRGLWFVNPKVPEKPTQLPVASPRDPARLERELYRTASRSAGPRVRVSSEALREVPKVLSTPNAALYLYIGKRNPDDPDDELYLLPARTYQQAKEGSVGAEVSAEHPPTAIVEPSTEPAAMATAMQAGGRVTSPDIDEGSSKYHNMISSMIRESLREAKRRK